MRKEGISRAARDEQFDIGGIFKNLERNIGIAYTLDGKGYRLGSSVKLLASQIQFMKLVIETGQLPYEIKRDIQGKARFSRSKLAGYAGLLPAFGRLLFDSLVLPPDLTLFHRIFSKHAIRQFSDTARNPLDQSFEAAFNDFVLNLRAEGKRIDIKRQMHGWQRNAVENAKRLASYLDALHQRYARLNVIRLDLLYRQAACQGSEEAKQWDQKLQALHARARDAGPQEPIDDLAHDLPRVDIITATQDWRHLKDNMRGKPSLFRDMVGYVCSIEFSSTGGHYLHVMLAFESPWITPQEWLGDLIGQYWVEITGGRGYFRNYAQGGHKHATTGLIEFDDLEKRPRLLSELMLLARKDQFVRVAVPPKSKTFMTGRFPMPSFSESEWRRAEDLASS
jgi:hypothetical protein